MFYSQHKLPNMNFSKYHPRLFSIVLLAAIAIVFATCKKYVSYKDVILITGTENTKVVKFTVESTPATFGVTASASGKVSEDITVNFAVDTSLVAVYNAERSANYYAAPAGSY